MMQLDLFSKFNSNCQYNKLILFDICAIFLWYNYLLFIYGANVSTKHCHWSLPIPKWLISLKTINTIVNETRHVCIAENKTDIQKFIERDVSSIYKSSIFYSKYYLIKDHWNDMKYKEFDYDCICVQKPAFDMRTIYHHADQTLNML